MLNKIGPRMLHCGTPQTISYATLIRLPNFVPGTIAFKPVI